MNCEKCKTAGMIQTKVFRMSGCLVALGFCLLIPAFCVLLCVGGFFALSAVITGSSAITVSQAAVTNTVSQLQAVEGLTNSYARLFETNQFAAREAVSSLEQPQQDQVKRILASYDAVRAGAALGTGVLGGLGTLFAVAIFFTMVPAMIVGFLLVMRKKVWLCRACGFIFDRA